MNFKLIDIINSISVFQLVIFAAFLIHKGRKNISNLLLITFFVAQLIVILNFLLLGLAKPSSNLYTSIAYMHYPFQYLWGPTIFFYAKSKLTRNFRFKPFDIIHFVPFILSTLFIIVSYYLKGYEVRQEIIKDHSIIFWFDYLVIPYSILLQAYTISGIILIYRFQRKLKSYFSSVKQKDLNWLKFVLYCYIVACVLATIPEFGKHFIPLSEDIVQLGIYLPFLIFFNLLFYKAITNPDVIIAPEEKPKQSVTGLDVEEIQDYASRIETIMNTEKPYLNHVLTLNDLSKTSGINERIISQVINQYWQQNFFSFINSYRIRETKIYLMDFDQKKSTMEGISYDSGFNSKSAFYEAFKKHTGMTPNKYRQQKA